MSVHFNLMCTVHIAQRTQQYNLLWSMHIGVLVWLSAVMMASLHYLPASFIIQLHLAAQHLGTWTACAPDDDIPATVPLCVLFALFALFA